MSPYTKLIAEAIEETDPATLAIVEEFMRTERTALDSLTLAGFRAAAREAAAEAVGMHAAGMLAGWCDAFQLAIPAWAA